MFDHGVRVGDVRDVASQLHALCAELDPNTIGLVEVPEVFDLFCGMQKAVEGAVTRLTPRYRTATTGKPGVRDPLEEVARKTGTSKTAARKRASAGEAAAKSPTLDDAMRTGALSGQQADAIAGAGEDTSEAQVGELVETARSGTLKELREAAARTRARGADAEARRRRVHANRRLSRWTDDEGAWHLQFNGLPAWGADINAALQPIIDEVFAQARRAGRHDDPGTYAADAFYWLLTGRTAGDATHADATHADATHADATGEDAQKTTGDDSDGTAIVGSAHTTDTPVAAEAHADGDTTPVAGFDQPARDQDPGRAATAGRGGPARRRSNLPVRPDRKVIATVPLQALRRGHLDDDETCEIAGVGPVSVATAREILGEGFLAIVIHDGVDALNVTHLGRQVTAHQRTALEARGYRCANPRCDATAHLQIDHVDDWALTHQTVLDDLDWLCHHDHDLKTNHGWTLTGPVGHRQFNPPSPDPTDRDPPPSRASPTSAHTYEQQRFTTAT